MQTMKDLGGRLALAVALGAFGCGVKHVPPIQTQAALGKVVVYRNGVAYFERRASVDGDTLWIRVPAERVDDFLKSLRVDDADTGKPLPVSFPTQEREGGEVVMRVRLPKPVPRAVRIAYVTESPSWKPSYRVELQPNGAALLEAWAVVDNVSGEDWDKVAVGVGSTSALSFRYDLHSVRVVERETLGDDPALAFAPPTGGSPYAVAKAENQMLGNFGQAALDQLTSQTELSRAAELSAADAPGPITLSSARQVTAAKAARPRRGRKDEGTPVAAPAAQPVAPPNAQSAAVIELANRLRTSKQHVRIEGFARSSERGDAQNASLRRANALRDVLVASGVPENQLEAVGTGKTNDAEGVRVLAASTNDPRPAQASTAGSDEPIGSSYFMAPVPLTIKRNHSAMVSILQTPTKAEQVYYFDPISPRGSRRFAFRALRIENPSQYTLDQGPFTVYTRGQFLGEGLSEPIPPRSTAFVPFALDRQVLIEPQTDTREEITRLTAIERGVVRTETKRILRTKLEIHNQGQDAAKLFVRHAVSNGYVLEPGKVKAEKLRGAYLFPITIPAKGTVDLAIEESTPTEKTINVRTDGGLKEIALFLQHPPKELDPDLQRRLSDILSSHRAMKSIEERIDTVHRQMDEYRRRVDEINAQLVSLRKVAQAQDLSGHLAKKMKEISDRLQRATIEVTDMEAQLMTQRIKLEDMVAELSL